MAAEFWARVDRSGEGCWEWQGAIGGRGYGSVNWGGTYKIASRLAWELTHGPIPAGLFVCHRCDNRRCVRPDHLFVGTHKDNLADMVSKGRSSRQLGSLSGRARLSEADILAIKQRLARGEYQKAIAADFGVHPAHICRINAGKRWPHMRQAA